MARFGHADDSELEVFKPWSTRGDDSISKQNAKYINIDVTTNKGILKGKELGLVPSGLVDVIFTTYRKSGAYLFLFGNRLMDTWTQHHKSSRTCTI